MSQQPYYETSYIPSSRTSRRKSERPCQQVPSAILVTEAGAEMLAPSYCVASAVLAYTIAKPARHLRAAEPQRRCQARCALKRAIGL